MYHESLAHDQNCFITLTYNDENLPLTQSLNIKDLQKFIKRLRKGNSRKNYPPATFRYYGCGEYGTDKSQWRNIGRPHYHLCLFGFDFPDKELESAEGDKYRWQSEMLTETWGKGRTQVGQFTPETAAYTAAYVTKKINGQMAHDHYQRTDEDGIQWPIRPEFSVMSRRPGIGEDFRSRFQGDFKKGYFTILGKRVPVPDYYKNGLAPEDQAELETIAYEVASKRNPLDETEERIQVAHEIQLRRQKNFQRS